MGRSFSCGFVVQAIKASAVDKERVVPRNKLSADARRAGYQGCTIHIGDLGRVDLVTPRLRDPKDCREKWGAAVLG